MVVMASKQSSLQAISLLLMLIFWPSLGSFITSSNYSSLDSLCNSTPFPDFCNSTLPHDKPGTIYDYARIFVQKSLSEATNFLSSVEYYLGHPSASFLGAVLALEDCRFLARLNIDFLSRTSGIINSTDNLQSLDADDLQTLLSAILTNQQTCLEGLQATESASDVMNDLQAPLSNGAKCFSVSLALFEHGWVPNSKKGRLLTERKHIFSNMEAGSERLPLRMSRKYRQIYESLGGRKLLQTCEDNVNISQMVVVNPDGTGNFTTINDAVAAAPNKTVSGAGYFLIYVVAGVYEEYVFIPKNKTYLMMIGAGINQTVITGNRSVADGWTTFSSATFAVFAQGFVAVNITFRNTAGAINKQAVAVLNGADLSTFYYCSFEGYQDTLCTYSLRQFYSNCDIYGTVDFIFGNAAVVLQNCNIYVRLPMVNQYNVVTAQGRITSCQNTGISIQNCTIRAADDLAFSNGTTKTFLGRPWKEYSRTVYMQSFMDSLIDPAGWKEWSGDFALSTLYYAEYNNTGPGSNTTNRVTWPGYHVINETEADGFTVFNFLVGDAWLPATGVPFNGGLS